MESTESLVILGLRLGFLVIWGGMAHTSVALFLSLEVRAIILPDSGLPVTAHTSEEAGNVCFTCPRTNVCWLFVSSYTILTLNILHKFLKYSEQLLRRVKQALPCSEQSHILSGALCCPLHGNNLISTGLGPSSEKRPSATDTEGVHLAPGCISESSLVWGLGLSEE